MRADDERIEKYRPRSAGLRPGTFQVASTNAPDAEIGAPTFFRTLAKENHACQPRA